MSILKNLNALRRILMRGITKHIGSADPSPTNDLTGKVEIKRVLICRPNHRLGNLLLITPIVEEIIATFPNCKIDLFVKGFLAPVLFNNYENISTIIQLPKKPFQNLLEYFNGWLSLKKDRYDLVVNVIGNSSSGRLAANFANAKFKFFGEGSVDLQLKYKDYTHNAKYPIYNLRNYLTKLGFRTNDEQVASLDLKLSPFEIAEGQKVLNNLVKNVKKTICIYTFATGDKCYSKSWWENFYQRLKIEYRDYNIIEVLPIENVSSIAFKAPAFYSKDIRQIGSLIANTEMFIGADSGIMHLASSVKIPTVGLFSTTDPNIYQPYDNNSVGINTNIYDVSECIDVVNRIINQEHSPKVRAAH